jgi:hypothetical protein
LRGKVNSLETEVKTKNNEIEEKDRAIVELTVALDVSILDLKIKAYRYFRKYLMAH